MPDLTLYTMLVDGQIPSPEMEEKRKRISEFDIRSHCSWYKHDEHMKQISKEHKDRVFALVGHPECGNNVWVKLYRGGKLVVNSKGQISQVISWMHDPDKVDDEHFMMLQQILGNYQLNNRIVASYTNTGDIPPMEESEYLIDKINPYDVEIRHNPIKIGGESVTILSPIDGKHITFENLGAEQANVLKTLHRKYTVLKNERQSK